MATDSTYEACLPVLQNESLDDEERTEALEEHMQKTTGLKGKALEDAVLDVLWRYRNTKTPLSSSPAIRHSNIRRASPARFQTSRTSTPLGASPRSTTASPATTPGVAARPSFFRVRSSQGLLPSASPFSSPRPSPRLAYATPQLQAGITFEDYESGDASDRLVDYKSDASDWVWNDDGSITTPSLAGYDPLTHGDTMLAAGAEMGPYDLLRSVLGDSYSDDELGAMLEANAYDMNATLASLMDTSASMQRDAEPRTVQSSYIVGKSMAQSSRPVTPAGQQRSPVPCRYWLSSGQCLRADCRFSHDISSIVCKYWMQGSCLAGDSCMFSHDPSALMSSMSLGNPSNSISTPPTEFYPSLNTHDKNYFPSLQIASPKQTSLKTLHSTNEGMAPPPGFTSAPALAPEFVPSRNQSHSRPSSRHQSPGPRNSSNFSVDDNESFPSLGSAASRLPKRHHGKRGHGHGHKEKDPLTTSLADVVRANTPTQSAQSPSRRGQKRGSYNAKSGENSAAAAAIPAPEHIPWLETGETANKAYLKARQEAIKHGSARNKFLQSAAQAWNRNDVRAAKALSLRGQSENDLMRESHREAAGYLYSDRNKNSSSTNEAYIDLHGLHTEEAVSYLSEALDKKRAGSALHRESNPYLYAIVGTGHHSKNGRDKVSRAIRAYLNECKYAFQEFSVPGDRNATGGIMGIDSSSGSSDASAVKRIMETDDPAEPSRSPAMQHGKVRILKAEDARAAALS